jgi:D-glycero-D-manno-heptose 1,7-bisphosphate phosphatase
MRKPRPGMLLDLGRRFGVPLDRVHAVGDSTRDVDAALEAGCKAVLVRTGHGREAEAALGVRREQVAVYNDLAAFAAALIATS